VKPFRVSFLLAGGLVFLATLEAAWLYAPPQVRPAGLISIGMVAGWRYFWLFLNIFRSAWYQVRIFPELRRRADSLKPSQWRPKLVHIILPTYMERPEVTHQVFQHLCREVAFLQCRTYIYVTSGGDEENEIIRTFFDTYPLPPEARLVFMTQEGKRHGMSYALRAARRRDPTMEGLVVLMDGDSLFGENLFARTFPLFALDPKLGAVTTNNLAVVEGPRWYRAWYTLRFALRNRYMCSQSVSRKVLTLTGRFSVFRGRAALQEDFINRVENDSIHTRAEGHIEFKTGDDKSTWFELLKEGWDMLYVPDAHILCMENAGERPFRESHAKMRRWFGNMLRNNMRALQLGPGRTGLFIWMAILDQRIGPWTSLLLPTTIVLNLVTQNPFSILFFAAWVVGTRCLYLATLTIEQHRLAPWDLPLIIYQQWAGSLIKISVLSNMKQQAWSTSRGDRGVEVAPVWSRLRRFSWLLLWVLAVALLTL